MNISVFIVNHVGENCYILWNGKSSDAVIIDPGMCDERERAAVDRFLTDNDLHLKCILLTHQHFDHILAARYIANKYGVDVCASTADNSLGMNLQQQVASFGLPYKCQPISVTHNLSDNDLLMLNGEKILVISVPGHSQGGLAFYLPESSCVFVGDSLFRRSFGRTDLPGGDSAQLINSVKQKLLTLPPDTVVYSGHGEATEIGEEQRLNPYLLYN